jgi:excisionase family DNA binding protein
VETEPLAHSIPKAAARIGIGRTLLYELIDRGEIPTITVGSRRLVAEADLAAFIELRRRQAA